EAGRAVAYAVASSVLAYALLIAIWPWTWDQAVDAPIQSFKKFSHYTGWDFTTLYDGEWLKADELPWSYLPRYFVYQTPEPVAVFSILGALWVTLVAVVRALRRRRLPVVYGLV